MDHNRLGSVSPRMTAGDAERVLQRAITHSVTLQRAFHISLSRRHDTQDWELFENATAISLEESKDAGHDAAWFAESDSRLKASVLALLRNRSSKSSRMGHYRRAADQVYESAAVWASVLDELTLAFWRHCALVWITLWHVADVPDLTVDQAGECLSFAFTDEGDLEPEPEIAPKRPSRWRLSAPPVR